MDDTSAQLWWLGLLMGWLMFLLSWQRVHGAPPPQVTTEIMTISASTPDYYWDVSDSQLCDSFTIYNLDRDSITTHSQPDHLKVTATTQLSKSSFDLVGKCKQSVQVIFPVKISSIWDEKPRLIASVSGEVSAANAARDDQIIFNLIDSDAVKTVMLFPSKGDSIEVGKPQIKPLDFGTTSTPSWQGWGKFLSLFLSDVSASWTYYRVATFLQATQIEHTGELAKCFSLADVFFNSPTGSSCWHWSGGRVYVDAYELLNKSLYSVLPDQSLVRLDINAGTSLPTEPGQLIISEVMWSGSFAGDLNIAQDEWIELYNNGESRLNLRGIRIEGGATNGGTLLIGADVYIEPFGYIIISRGLATTQLSRKADWSSSFLSLSNTQSRLVLRLPNGTELDRTPDGIWQAGLNDVTGKRRASAQRVGFDQPGHLWESWETCDLEHRACEMMSKFWREPGGQNLGTPWQPTVL